MKVIGIGQCSLDNLFVIDTFPAPDTKKEITEWTTAGGGPVATALVSLSRLGCDCAIHGITGDDEAGEKIARSIKSEGIDISGLITRPNSFSQVAFIAVEAKNGKRTIFWKRPSAEPLSSGELPGDFADNADFLLLDGLMPEVSIYAAKKAKERNIPVMLDAGHVRKGMIELARLCDYVVCSEEFAKEFSDDHDNFNAEEAAMSMRSFGSRAVTITLGVHGSITVSKDNVFRTPAFKVDVVDTTGAGDVFHGGYIYGLLQGWDIERVVRFASAFSALKCRKLGGRAGIPALQEVNDFLSAHSSENNL